MSWDLIIGDPQEVAVSILLPSSLRDVWDVDISPADVADPTTHARSPLRRSTYAGSAPALGSRPRSQLSRRFFYSVHFHAIRSQVFVSTSEFADGDWVIVDADRGFDIGQVIAHVRPPPARDQRALKAIVRRATDREVSAIPEKQDREVAALTLCQTKARELGLPMEVTGAEIQFDGMKVTFYYAATRYVDFRDLVRSLFKQFGTRIWMVWCDKEGPVKDVVTRRGRDLMSRPLEV
jgi:hypothetical protein